ncbi:transporter substrate-binding domain-containing protein [Marinobacter sp. 1-3A]|uniref:substrate-binding periplasmic protein n=1 Tax=Marinobacter sp. 1-3A TaxID=2582920 RepID=UPI001906CC08|nr:transporter substrate-binding domain-containing protein [Marinobacter sp. 1-3A]MBK1873117.1 transporter substrate-binding domain-containing protein [Marinobacter sp. 1-3A]
MLRAILAVLFISLAGCSPPDEKPASITSQSADTPDVTLSANRDKFTVIIAADPWCPHNCIAGSGREGYAIDIARAVFASAGYRVEYMNAGWARAIQLAKDNHADAVVGAFRGDVPDFIFPLEPIGISRTHLYTNAESQWVYNGIASLKGRTLLAINGYSYSPELDSYIERNHQNQGSVWLLSGPAPLSRAVVLLDQRRTDIFVEDGLVMNWALQNQAALPAPRDAGEIHRAPFYIAFSPANPKAAELARILSDGIRNLRQSGQFDDILASYGVPLLSVD